MTTPAEAIALKDEGNEAFRNKDLTKAISCYTKALEIKENPLFYSNRAQVYIKSELYGLAIEDASKALELDSDNIKAYYRRAVAKTAILRHSEALSDWAVVLKRTNDKSAKLQHSECKRIVKRDAFLKAIEVEDEPSAADGLELDSMIVDSNYDGVRLEKEITQEFVDDMIERFRNEKKIHGKYVYQIILAVKDILLKEPTMVEIDVAENTKLTVCGDTHGQYFDLLNIFKINGYPSSTHSYLFNGDFVDRGSWSTEVVLLLYAYKWLYPQNLLLNRGNHETDDMNRMYGFEGECRAKYNERVFKLFSESFSALPLATLIGQQYLVLHGGLFSDDDVTLDNIRKLDRLRYRQPRKDGIIMEMLWADPQTIPGRLPSKRGVGMQFGPDVTKRFCEKNNLKAVIRSHEVRMEGYEVEHEGRCITVFSAPFYCDNTENKGAFVDINSNLELNFTVFDAVPHPPTRAMAYAPTSPFSLM